MLKPCRSLECGVWCIGCDDDVPRKPRRNPQPAAVIETLQRREINAINANRVEEDERYECRDRHRRRAR